MEEHKLIVQSLHDGQAKCSCGKWGFSQTGITTRQEIFDEFTKHLEQTD